MANTVDGRSTASGQRKRHPGHEMHLSLPWDFLICAEQGQVIPMTTRLRRRCWPISQRSVWFFDDDPGRCKLQPDIQITNILEDNDIELLTEDRVGQHGEFLNALVGH